MPTYTIHQSIVQILMTTKKPTSFNECHPFKTKQWNPHLSWKIKLKSWKRSKTKFYIIILISIIYLRRGYARQILTNNIRSCFNPQKMSQHNLFDLRGNMSLLLHSCRKVIYLERGKEVSLWWLLNFGRSAEEIRVEISLRLLVMHGRNIPKNKAKGSKPVLLLKNGVMIWTLFCVLFSQTFFAFFTEINHVDFRSFVLSWS